MDVLEKLDLTRVYVWVNENGIPTNIVRGLQFGDNIFHADPFVNEGCKFSVRDKVMQFGRTKTRVFSHAPNRGGNWNWDEIVISRTDLAKIIRYVQTHKWWCEQAESELSQLFEQGSPIRRNDIANADNQSHTNKGGKE